MALKISPMAIDASVMKRKPLTHLEPGQRDRVRTCRSGKQASCLRRYDNCARALSAVSVRDIVQPAGKVGDFEDRLGFVDEDE